MIRFWLLVVGLVSLAACGITAAAPAPTDSGIRGRVLIGPMCPVVQEGIPCLDQPLVATIRVRRPGGKLVATVHSGKDGRFRSTSLPAATGWCPCRRVRPLFRMQRRSSRVSVRMHSRALRFSTTAAFADTRPRWRRRSRQAPDRAEQGSRRSRCLGRATVDEACARAGIEHRVHPHALSPFAGHCVGPRGEDVAATPGRCGTAGAQRRPSGP